MKLLLDSHVLLWWLDDPALLSMVARDAISDPSNDVLVSAAMVWEIVIKSGLGKLAIPADLDKVIVRSGFQYLAVNSVHAFAVQQLPLHHRDPFDRMLVAQAIVESATIITRDANIVRYPANCIGA
jgi:PIN domain nuclease of toxin-antitoxin system